MAEDDRNLDTLTLHPQRDGPSPPILDAPISFRERITLRDLHSSGGIGEVWIAYDEVLGREIALKRLKSDKATLASNRARFFREAQITGQLDHPGIVPVYDFSSNHDGSQCFYTMRFLRGRTLRQVIAEFHAERIAHSLPVVTGSFLHLLGHFASICNTIAFAHSRRVIHRDIKGDNVIIGDYGEVVVLDWGLAKRLGGERLADELELEPEPLRLDASTTATLQGEQLGTPAYMAPEQASGEIDRIDHRTDVYGLAALLYEILTGQPPFLGRDVVAVLKAVVLDVPLAPRERVADVPLELEGICLQGLAKPPEQRQQSVTELAEQVQRWIDHLTEQRRTEQERERFFDLSLDLLVILDHQGRFEQSNPAWTRLLGWTAEARAGAALLEFIVDEDRPLAERALAEITGGAERTTFEVRMIANPSASPSGSRSTCWVDWNVRSIPGQRACYLVGRDISERKHAEQEFRGLLESAPDAMIVVDHDGVICLANRRLETLFGHPRAELIGQPIEILLPHRLRAAHLEHMLRYAANPQPRTMGQGRLLYGLHADGSEFPIDISLSPVEARDGARVCCAMRPVFRGHQ